MDNTVASGDFIRPEAPLVNSDGEDEIRVTGCADTFYDPKGGGHRFIALILMCIIGFGKIECSKMLLFLVL